MRHFPAESKLKLFTSIARLTLARILFSQCPEIDVPSCVILVARSQVGVPATEELVAVLYAW